MLHLPAAILRPTLSVTMSGLELPQVRSAFHSVQTWPRDRDTSQIIISYDKIFCHQIVHEMIPSNTSSFFFNFQSWICPSRGQRKAVVEARQRLQRVSICLASHDEWPVLAGGR